MNKILICVFLLGLTLAEHSVAKHAWTNNDGAMTYLIDEYLSYYWKLSYDAYYEELYEPVLGKKWTTTEVWGLMLDT